MDTQPGRASAKHRHRSLRLQGYDYAQAGAYFVTICVRNRACLLGAVMVDEMRLNQYGQVVADCWEWLPRQYPCVELDEWVVMPNHLHGIVLISEDSGGSRPAPTPIANAERKPLGSLVGAFKTVSAKRINQLRRTPGVPVWQRNYFEHVIRSQPALDRIRRYIFENPSNWATDRENPAVKETKDPLFWGRV
jgi:REP-associated tyrosine transposase